MKQFLILFLVACHALIYAQTIDPNFNASITDNAEPLGVVFQDDGKYIVYGQFISVNGISRSGLNRFNPDGTTDNTFNIGQGANAEISAVAIQDDGKILAAGHFTTFNGQPRKTLVRLHANGEIDSQFNPKIDLQVYSNQFDLLVQPDQRILLGGPLAAIDGIPRHSRLVRLNEDGTRDNSFADVPTYLSDFALQSNGKIVIVGNDLPYKISRLHTDGTVDDSFNPGTGFDSGAIDIEVDDNDHIIAGGFFETFNGAANRGLVRLSPSGSLDLTFQGNGQVNNSVRKILCLPNEKILVAGSFSNFAGLLANRLIRLNEDGTHDNSLMIEAGPNLALSFAAINASEDIALIGAFTTFNNQPRNRLAIITNTGTLKAINENLDLRKASTGSAILAQGEKILLSHIGNYTNNQAIRGFARLNLDGSLDESFAGNSKPNSSVYAIAEGESGKILIGGIFTTYDGIPVGRIARLLSDGILDNAFNANSGTGFDNAVRSIAVQADHKILIGGFFSSFNGVTKKLIVRLNEDGTLDEGFNVTDIFSSSTGFITSIELQQDNRILIGGSFSGTGMQGSKSLLRLNHDGSIDDTFQIGSGAAISGPTLSEIKSINVLSNGKILLGGRFDYFNGVNQRDFTILNSNGSIDQSLVTQGYFNVEEIFERANGAILVVDSNKGISALNADGTQDWNFKPIKKKGTNNRLCQIGQKLFITGAVTSIDGTSVAGVAQIVLSTSKSPSMLVVTSVATRQIEIQWQDNTTQETSFEIFRSISDGAFELVQSLPSNSTSFIDDGLMPNTRYNYVVKARCPDESDALSEKVSQTTLPDPWSQIVINVPPRSGGIAIALNGKAYIGLGRNNDGLLQDWWEYNPQSNLWTPKLDFPGPARIGAVAFSVNSKIYVGTGNDESGSGFLRDFYEYDPQSDLWTIKAEIPKDLDSDAGITSGVAFAINNFGYVGLGNTGISNTTAFFKYDPVSNTWLSISPFPASGRPGAIAFVHGENAYVGFGFGGLAPNKNDLYEYHTQTNTWTAKANSNGSGRGGAAVSVLEGSAYVIAGVENNIGFNGIDTYTNSSFAFDPDANSWSTVSPFPGTGRTDAHAFSLGSNVFLFGGYRSQQGHVYFSDMYKYTRPTSFLLQSPINLSFRNSSTYLTHLYWEDTSDNESGYIIEVAVGGTDVFSIIATVPANSIEYTHFGLIPDIQYKYRIRATNEYFISAYSNIVTRKAMDIPLPPSNLTVEGTSASSMVLKWQDHSSNEDGFLIYRSEGDRSNYGLHHTTGANETLWQDSGLAAATKYYYKIEAANAGGTSGFAEATAPVAPSILSVKAFDQTTITLNWSDSSTDESGFEVYRSVNDNSNFVFQGSLSQNVTQYVQTGLSAGVRYFYRIIAKVGSNKSLHSNQISQTTLPYPPIAPSGLTIDTVTATTISLKWVDNSNNEFGFTIERSGLDATFVVLDTIPVNTVSYLDTDLLPATGYSYRVRAFNVGGMSAHTSVVSQSTLPNPPNAPSDIDVSIISATRLKITWRDNSINETGFELYRSTSTDDDFQLVGTTSTDVTTYTDSGLKTETTYFYKIRATNTGGNSQFSSTVSTLITAIEQQENINLVDVYPSPFNDELMIHNKRQEEIKVSIYTLNGQQVGQEKLGPNASKRMQTSAWPLGVYVIKISGSSFATKAVKY